MRVEKTPGLMGFVARVSKSGGSFLLAGRRGRADQISGRSGRFALPNYEVLGWSFPANLTLTSRPIQFRSGLNPTQSDPIQPNPAYDKKINPRNRGTQLLKQYDQIALNRTKSHQI
jgi:hypothetical protein